jgi:hypothetical protein
VELAAAKSIVEEAVKKLGVNPDEVRARDAADQVAWALKRGSAQILVAAIVREGGTVLRVVAPVVVYEPSKKDALFAKLLELNGEGIASCAFGVMKDRVVVISEQPAEGLDAGRVQSIVKAVAAVADTWDDKLVQDFGGRRASDK